MVDSKQLEKPFSSLQKLRHQFVPQTPSCYSDEGTKISIKKSSLPIQKQLYDLFPTLLAGGADSMQQFEVVVDPNGQPLKSERPMRIGCVLSGGQAAGGHNVIMGLFDMVKKLHPESKLFGFLAGPHGVFSNNYMEITSEYMGLYRNMGGFDMIRSGRHKIETPQQFADSLKNATDLDLDGLVVIGGDDSNTNACLLAEYFKKNNAKTRVIGCPKTIDGDLQNEHIPVSFGFDTATKVYSEAIGNLCSDVMSSKEMYHFVRLMGRSASHIALECALRTQINCLLIGEEVQAENMTLSQVTTLVADIICKRAELGKNYGIILVPEGLIEFIPEMSVLIGEINEILSKEFSGDIRDHVSKHLTFQSRALFQFLPHSISSQLLLDRDPHGNVQVSKIDTEKLLILLLKQELKTRSEDGVFNGEFNPQSHFFGYEGRCALPSNFDSQYCYSLGLNAAVLIKEGLSGYMSCCKNLTDSNPYNWQAAGCPLPTMMGVERRKGKDVPVISKALVRLDGGMFKAYAAVRDKWAYLDCYKSPGPIQFSGAGSISIPFMVSPPVIDDLIRETQRFEELENAVQSGDSSSRLQRDSSLLSELSRARVQDEAEIPEQLEKGAYFVSGVKKYFANTQQVATKLVQQLPDLCKFTKASYFVEIQDKLLTNKRFRNDDQDLLKANTEWLSTDISAAQRIGVIFMGRQAPGANNVIDGLLRFRAQRKNVELIGFINGVTGLMNDQYATLTEETFANYKNLGGIDYIGRGPDELRTEQQVAKAISTAKSLNLTGLVLVGATHTLTDGVYLADAFVREGVNTRVICVPCTVDGNIHHNYIQASIGFDSATKVFSQLIGNMLTDSASAIKYWYFIRLMGKEPSHLALECALKTSPNMVIISEEAADRHETLADIVNDLCDQISMRADKGMNYGCILIPEGLLSNISSFKTLITELNSIFTNINDEKAQIELGEKLHDDREIKKILTPWSYSLFSTLPEFFRNQMLLQRNIAGTIKLSQIETEKLLSYLVEQELKNRKKSGSYSGSFAPVTHFFGYQGRSGHPSKFDCSLGSTYGFAAGVLVENGLTGVCASISQCTMRPSEWRVGAVPIMSLLASHPKEGYKRSTLVVRSEEVNLRGRSFQHYKAQSKLWRVQDRYENPGPIQFYSADDEENNRVTDSLIIRYGKSDDLMENIRGLCNSIQNDSLFTEHQHLLHAALSSLKSAKEVINSLSHTTGV